MRIDAIKFDDIIIKPEEQFNNKCLICEKKFRPHDIKICYECCKKHNLLMCKSDVKSQYFLSDKDLEEIRYLTKKHTTWKKVNMLLYLVNDVIKIAKKKYNIKTKKELSIFLDEKRKSRNDKKTERNKTKQIIINERQNKLKQKLDDYGLPLRNDSTLCWKYITAGIGDINEIAEIMKGMEFLYNHTKYHEMMGKKINDELQICREFGIHFENSDINEIRDEVKKQCVNQYIKQNGKKSVANLPDYLLQYVK
jgi:hypothetical protein